MNQTNPETNPKAAHGAAKAPFFGIPWSAVVWLANVMRGGALKYGFYNYRETKIAASTYHDAIMRHFLLWADGEDIDSESGCPHLAHVMACCALYLDANELDMVTDDRNKTGVMGAILAESALVAQQYEEKLKQQGRHLYDDEKLKEVTKDYVSSWHPGARGRG